MKKYFDGMAVLMASAWVAACGWQVYRCTGAVSIVDGQEYGGNAGGQTICRNRLYGMVCALYLLLYLSATYGKPMLRQSRFWIVAACC